MNDYYSASPLTPNTVARAADVNSRFQGVETAFDLLPPPEYISQNKLTYAVDSGAANALVANPAIPITSYDDGLRLTVKAAASNTAATTINVSGLGVKEVVRADGSTLEVGDIVAGQVLDLTYDTLIGKFRLSMAFAELSPAGVLAKLLAAGAVALTSAFSTTSTVTATGGVITPSMTLNGIVLSAPTAHGKTLLESANASTSRTLLGLGTMATETAANYAPLASPALTGNPTAPTQTAGNNSTRLATTAFVQTAIAGVSLTGYAQLAAANNFTDNQTITGNLTVSGTVSVADSAYGVGWNGSTLVPTRNALYDKIETLAPLSNPVFSGTVSVSGALTVTNEAYGVGWNGATSVPTKNAVYDEMETRASLASPAFTGTPTAPTATVGTNNTQIATTAFVKSQNYLTASSLTGYATLASPVFTGSPLAPTPSTSDNTTKIATTAFVKNQSYATTSQLSSYLTTATAASTYAPLASPALTGNPTATTQSAGNNSTRIATTAFVTTALNNYSPSLTVTNFTANRTLADSDNNTMLRHTSATNHTVTLNSTPSAGTSCIIANRAAGNVTLSGTIYLNGATSTVSSCAISTGGAVTVIHEGSGTWLVQGSGVA